MVATMCKMFIVHIPHSEFYIKIGKLVGFSWLAMAKKTTILYIHKPNKHKKQKSLNCRKLELIFYGFVR